MFGLYIHIPFCVKKCLYCDFPSRPERSGEMDRYVEALSEELRLFAKGNQRIVETLYIGGGTPTLLSQDQLSALFAAVRTSMTLLDDAEVTIEANPGTLDWIKVKHLLSLGVNRISLGVQSLQDRLLERLGRIHSAAQALEGFELLRSAGFLNIGVDLIYGLPAQRLKDWEEDLERMVSLRPDHLSLYGLSVEKGTPFERELKKGTLELPGEEEELAMFHAAGDIARAGGYEHYEISNYARPGYRSRHNRLYWTLQEYYGAGAGAHSFLTMDGPLRLSNVRDPADYIGRMEGSRDPVAKREFLKKKTFLGEAMMLGLRMTEGVRVDTYRRRFGVDPLAHFSATLARAREQGWIEVAEGCIRLTESGLLFSNEVFVDLF